MTPMRFDLRTSKYDLGMFLEEYTTGIAGELLFKTDLFDRSTVQRMVLRYQTLLETVAANPDTPINALELVSDHEREADRIAAESRTTSQVEVLRSVRLKRTVGV